MNFREVNKLTVKKYNKFKRLKAKNLVCYHYLKHDVIKEKTKFEKKEKSDGEMEIDQTGETKKES